MKSDENKKFIDDVTNLKEKKVLEQVKIRLLKKDDPLTIIEDCEKGMIRVGELYEQGTYFISGLIVAGELFRQVAELVQPEIKSNLGGRKEGSILLGTVHGDIHELGKNLFGLLIKCHGFMVHDLGVDVPAEEFCNKALEFKPDIIGLSGLLTSAHDAMRETVKLIKEHDDPKVAKIPIIIRSSLPESDELNKFIGADYWAGSAMAGVRMCKQIMSKKSNK
ncbi:MAG: cobalamin-dependent protein [Desulfobacteraceae bacterium]|jgi:methanogenic corrinoid protein MtbC1